MKNEVKELQDEVKELRIQLSRANRENEYLIETMCRLHSASVYAMELTRPYFEHVRDRKLREFPHNFSFKANGD